MRKWGLKVFSIKTVCIPLGYSLGFLAVFSVTGYAASNKSKETPTSVVNYGYPNLPESVQARISSKNQIHPNAEKGAGLQQGIQWPLSNIGFFDVFNTKIHPIRSQVLNCSDKIVVAIVDTGIDYTHPDLANNLWINSGEAGPWEPSMEQVAKGFKGLCRDKSCNGIDDDANGFVDDVVGWDFVHNIPLPYDTHGHGTHIAGIIGSEAAQANSGSVGVCPNVSLMALKYYDNSGSGYNNLTNTVRAIEYAVANGANIINYSGGGAEPAANEKAAVELAHKRGILFVAAAGNDGHNNDRVPYFPASYGLDNIISVASVNRLNRLLPSSNFGKSVHLAAPGLMILSTLPGNRYGTMSGTSQATAFVTGAAALLASQTNGFDYKQLKSFLLKGAKPLPVPTENMTLASGLLSLPNSLENQLAAKSKISASIASKDTSKKAPVIH